MQRMLPPEQVVLSLQVAVTGPPGVVRLAGKVGVQPFLTALPQQPVDIAGQLLRKLPLLINHRQLNGRERAAL